MTAVTVMPHDEARAWLPRDHDWTVDDLEHLPDDGLQYELFDGVLVVSPAPTRAHQRAAGRLFRLLDGVCPDTFEVLVAPLDFQPTNRRSTQPDVLVVSRDDPDDKALHRPPLLVAEVLSPSTKTKDLLLKKDVYESSGVPHFWVVDPGLDKSGTPVVTVYVLEDAAYQERGSARGTDTLEVAEPFPVRVCPADLISR